MPNQLRCGVIFASAICLQCGSSDSSDTAYADVNTTAAANGVMGSGSEVTSTSTGPTTTSAGAAETVIGGTSAGPVSGTTGEPSTTGGQGVSSATTTTAGTATGGGGAGSTTTDASTTTTGGPEPVVLPPVVTSAPGEYWKADGTLTEGGTATVSVGTQEAQTWDGFGAAFNEKGWAALTSDAAKKEAITLLFSAAEGANFAWGRIPIGASDYGLDRYTLADTGTDHDPMPSGESNRPPPAPNLETFSLERDHELLIPYIKAALEEKGDLRFWASPWTPPVWMKTGYKQNSGADSSQNANRPSFYDGGNMNAEYLATYAEYFVKFVEGYAAEGIDIEVVSPQNEPGYDQNYPSCLWSGATFTAFVAEHLGPKMQALGVSIMLGSLSNDSTDFTIASTALANTTAKGFFSVIGAQWNTLDKARLDGLGSGLPYWGSEHKCGNYPWNPQGYPSYSQTPPNDQAYAVESWGYIRDAIKTVGVTSYNAWNMVLDSTGLGNDTTRHWAQNSLLVGNNDGTVATTPTYYVFRHFSQYVQPGAKVLSTTGGDAVAFKNPDGSTVVVMYNSGAANPNYGVSIAGTSYQFAMPSNGWATVKIGP